ncbi:hypothetical protein QAD02_012858 [Eretmocerus hayati]|uniref:Uncharacterized protein n=1 Tax=Eretmocerus hayati TaxID=131215 RepID=A0ACC2P1X9_9HYME|nr:hypothetical protein QAD02_012858 [Eretmocerus hayati]
MEELILDTNSQSSRITHFIENTLKQEKGSERKPTRADYKRRLELLESYWKNFYTTDRSIARCREAAPHIYTTDDVFGMTETAYLDAASQIQEFIDKLTVNTPAGTSSAPTAASSTAHEVVQFLQLPKLDLPSFSGDPLQ